MRGIYIDNVLLTAIPTASDASTITVDAGGNLTITDTDGTINNQFQISGNGTSITIHDASGGTINTGGMGSGSGSDTVTINLSEFGGGIVVNSGGGDDTLSVNLATALGRALTFNGGDPTAAPASFWSSPAAHSLP